MKWGWTLLYALDQFFAALLYNRPDLTISTLCWLVRANKDSPLKLNSLQRWTLDVLGRGLEWMFPGHLESAREADYARGVWLVSITAVNRSAS